MNLKSHSTFKILFFTIYLLIGILLSLSKNTQYLSTEYNFILTAYFITGGAWGLCIYKKNIYIFEPATIVLGLTIITYAVAPLISINTNDLTINGFYVFDGCVEATIIYILAFCLFLFIYYSQPPISFNSILKSATKPLNVLIAFTRPLITEFADNLNLKHPLLPTISPYPTM